MDTYQYNMLSGWVTLIYAHVLGQTFMAGVVFVIAIINFISALFHVATDE